MRLLFDDWKLKFKKSYKNPAEVSGQCCSHTALPAAPAAPRRPVQRMPLLPLPGVLISNHLLDGRCCHAVLQDKTAFVKFQANVKDLAFQNAKNGWFSALTTYSDLSWADIQARVLNNIRPKQAVKKR
jgi:hypothetical protein